MKQLFQIQHKNPDRKNVMELAIAAIRERFKFEDFTIILDEIRRTIDQNAAMWPALQDIAGQVPWPHTRLGNWIVDLMPKESWKSVMTAAYQEETEMAQGLNGGLVMIGARTSKYSRKKMGEFLTFLHAEGDARGVQWSAAADKNLIEYTTSRKAKTEGVSHE